MYVWRNKYRKERLNVYAETLPESLQLEEGHRDEFMREQLEKEFVATTLLLIGQTVEKYLSTEGGLLEIELTKKRILPITISGPSNQALIKSAVPPSPDVPTDTTLKPTSRSLSWLSFTSNKPKDKPPNPRMELLRSIVLLYTPQHDSIPQNTLYQLLHDIETKAQVKFNYDKLMDAFERQEHISFDEFYTCKLARPPLFPPQTLICLPRVCTSSIPLVISHAITEK